MSWFIGLLVGLVLNIVAYLILPKPKQEKPEAAQDGEAPVANPGKPVPVVFGTLVVKELAVLDWKDKNQLTLQVEV